MTILETNAVVKWKTSMCKIDKEVNVIYLAEALLYVQITLHYVQGSTFFVVYIRCDRNRGRKRERIGGTRSEASEKRELRFVVVEIFRGSSPRLLGKYWHSDIARFARTCVQATCSRWKVSKDICFTCAHQHKRVPHTRSENIHIWRFCSRFGGK